MMLLHSGAGTVPVRAASITESQARAKAQSFLQTRHPAASGKRLVVGNASMRSVPQRRNMGNSAPTPALYVFNVGEQEGFVIVSGDDRTRSILGYADSGTFDADRMPTALREMLAIYARQIEDIGAGPVPARSDSASHAYRAPRRISSTMVDIAPLLTTTWDQGAPYNDYCPTLNDQTALTGCVATAMAQIAYYHKFPTAQVPSLAAYTSATNKINVSAWGATTFDWDNMLDSYSGSVGGDLQSPTSAQKAAVATLMRYCGQAAQMDYGFTSGAYNGDALYAFKEKLGYNANANFKSAASYSVNGWEDLIYKEVREGRPVYYSALNGDSGNDVGGHAFVIDGYQADGNYFHVNWGWGGACNGYFNLFALDPSAPQSAATSTGWHYQMLALIGLSPQEVNTAKLLKDASGSWLITSTDDWNELSSNLEAYNGGSFKLTADITVTTMVGIDENSSFNGTFDGQGHILTVNIESDNYHTAPFRLVNGGSNIKNLKVKGTVSSSFYHAAGLIGGFTNRHDNTSVYITNCEVAVQVNGTEYAGGFVGHSWVMQPVFTDCIFSGSINGCHTHGCFVGWKEWESRPVYVNCLSIPTSFGDGDPCDFSHPGNGGSENDATLTNCYSSNAVRFCLTQGKTATSNQLADGSIAHALQNGSRNWTTGLVWGQLIGVDELPLLTNDASKKVNVVTFTLEGQTMKTFFTNGALGEKMPVGEDFGLKNASFTCNGAAFTSTTPINSDITVVVTGTAAFTLTLGTPANGTISINNTTCLPGTLKKVTATPANGYKLNTVTVTDANGKALPVTQVSNNANEFVFAFPKSSVTVTADFTSGEAEAIRFINGGMTLPSSWRNGEQSWTADTWTIWGDEWNGSDIVFVGAPPTDALGYKWYEEDYALTNSDADVQPNGNKIVWENHSALFRKDGNYDYFRECGVTEGERTGDFYIRRIFTFDTETVPTKLYLSCNYDGTPAEFYINGTLVYQDHRFSEWCPDFFEVELTPEQIALLHTDGTPNVLAAHAAQDLGDYFLDCGLYDPTAISYEVTSENTVRVLRNAFITGDVIIPETITANGVTYTVTELADDVFNECHNGLTSVCLPQTLTNVGNNGFRGCDGIQYVKSYVPIYLDQDLVAAPAAATEFELPMGYARLWKYAFGFTESLKTLTLPRSLTYIDQYAFVGCTALTDIYAYARPVPQTEWNAFEGIDKSKITVHVYASALDSYKDTWGEEFNYVTMTDPQPITLTIDVADAGSLRTLIEAAAANQGSTIYDVTGITVTGNLNQDDLWTLSGMCTSVYALSTIDLSGATIENNYIGDNVFRDREKLTSIVLPETLEYINDASFHNCDGLTTIDIPASVKRIWHNAFSYCDNLTTVTGLEGLSANDSYGAWDVFYATAITHPVYGGSVFLYMPPSMTGDYEVPAGIKMTTADAFRHSRLSSVILPASITILGDDTFRDCPNLTDIYCYATTPPECVSGVWEFEFDRGACTVHVPASAVEDYQNAGEWNEMGRIVGIVTGDLVDMTLNVATAGTLGDELFNAAVANANISDKTLIRNLTVTGSLNADDIAYLNTLPNTLYNMEQLDLSATTLEGNTITEHMFYQTSYKTIKLPETVTTIGYEAFRNSRRLREVTLPTALETLGPWAFAECGLTSITIPEGVTEMGDRVFISCYALAKINMGNNITHIPECWAEFCNLEELTIGKKVSSIAWRAFRGAGIKHVYCYAKTPPTWNSSEAFYDGINEDAVLHVYSNSVKRYQSAGGWQDFPNIVGDLGTYTTYDITVNETEMGTFSEAIATAMTTTHCEDKADISKLTVTGKMNQDDLNYLRDYVGAYLDKLDLGGVTVENNNFGYQTLSRGGFEEVILPANLERMEGWSVLEDCHNLKTIVIPNSVTYLGAGTLGGNTALESVTIGKRVNYFGWRTFCVTNIKDIYCLAKTPPAWDNDIFADGNYPEVVHVYANYLERYQNANGWKNLPNIVGDLGDYPSYDITVNVAEMGKFSEALSAAMTTAGCKDMIDISKLIVTGSVNQDDLHFIHDNVGATLDTLDLGEVTVENNTMPDGSVLNYCGYEVLILPASLKKFDGSDYLIGCERLKDIYFRAVEIPLTGVYAFTDFDCSRCALHVYEEMVEVFQNDGIWGGFNIVGDLGPMPNLTPMNEKDYADLCAINNILGGSNWTTKWITNKNVQTASRWRGATFDEEGYVTAIDLHENGLNGDISSLAFTGLTKLTSVNLSGNAITGDIQLLAASLPAGCKLYVESQDLGYVGEHTLYEMCNYGGLPSIAYYMSGSGTLASSIIGVSGECHFYHGGTDGGYYWDSYISLYYEPVGNNRFYWPSPVTIECVYPHRFTFTYKYEMGDANMDDEVNVLDLQATLNSSNGQEWGLFNHYAADTYGQDGDINVQDIVATVNILLAQENNSTSRIDGNFGGSEIVKRQLVNRQSPEACVSVENGQIVLYTTVPVAALDLRLTGIEPEALTWNTEAMGFATAVGHASQRDINGTEQTNGTHAIIYSLQPREIAEGRTVLATFSPLTSHPSPLIEAVLSDSKARFISVSNGTPTGISQMNGDIVSQWSLTDLSGKRLAEGTNATEADILRMAKSEQLHGVFILNMNGAKRKIVVK